MAQNIELLLRAKNLTEEAFRAIEQDLRDVDKKAERANKTFTRLKQGLDNFGTGALRLGAGLTAGVTLPIVALGAASLKAAMDAVESENLFQESFKGMAQAARTWSEEVSAAVGSNEFELRRNAATLFTMANSMKVAKDDAFKMATGLTELAGDMASFYNLPHEVVFQKIQAGLTGEAEPMKRLGILLDANTIKTVAYQAGIAKQGEALTEVQKVQARYLAMMQQTSDAQGDLARTLDSPTNQMRIMKEQLNQLAIEFGIALLPMMKDVLTIARDDLVPALKSMVDWFTNLAPATQKVVIVSGALAAALGPVLIVLGTLASSVSSLLPLLGVAGLGKLLPSATSLTNAWHVANMRADKALVLMAGKLKGQVVASLVGFTKGVKGAGLALKGMAGTIGAAFAVGGAAYLLTDWLMKNTELGQKFSDTVKQAWLNVMGINLKELEKGKGFFEGKTPEQIKSYLDHVKRVREMQKSLNVETRDGAKATRAYGAALGGYLGKGANQFLRSLQGMVDGENERLATMEAHNRILTTATIPAEAAFVATLQEMNDSAEDSDAVLLDLSKKAGEVAKDFETATGEVSEFEKSLAKLPGVILAAIQGGGDVFRAIGASLGGDLGTQLGKGLTESLSGLLGKSLGGSIAGLLGPVGALAGSALGGLVESLFGGDKEIRRVNDLRDQFFALQGGFEAFSRKMAEVSAQDWAKKIFDAKTVDEFNRLVTEANGLLGLQTQAEQDLQAAVEKYGFSIEELGPKWQQQELDKMAGQLLKEYELLTKSGIDQALVLDKMGVNLSNYVQTALAAGQSVPEAMRQMIEAAIANGEILDENGKAYESVEAAGISFTQSLTDGLSRVIASIEKLVAALTGIPPVNIPVNYQTPGLPPGYKPGVGIPEAARGTVVLPFRPRPAASGALVGAQPGGELFRLGEGGGAEVVAPVKALFGQLGDAIAGKVAGAVGRIDVHAHVYLDGQEIGNDVMRRNRAGLLTIREGSTRRY